MLGKKDENIILYVLTADEEDVESLAPQVRVILNRNNVDTIDELLTKWEDEG